MGHCVPLGQIWFLPWKCHGGHFASVSFLWLNHEKLTWLREVRPCSAGDIVLEILLDCNSWEGSLLFHVFSVDKGFHWSPISRLLDVNYCVSHLLMSSDWCMRCCFLRSFGLLHDIKMDIIVESTGLVIIKGVASEIEPKLIKVNSVTFPHKVDLDTCYPLKYANTVMWLKCDKFNGCECSDDFSFFISRGTICCV